MKALGVITETYINLQCEACKEIVWVRASEYIKIKERLKRREIVDMTCTNCQDTTKLSKKEFVKLFSGIILEA